MTKKEIMNELKNMNVAFDNKAKKADLEKLLESAKIKQTTSENTAIVERAKEKKVKVSREQRLANIASYITEAYDYSFTIKRMSNHSIAVKKDKMRLFRLDLLAKEYQLTSDRDTLLKADSRVESIYEAKKNKFYYRFRSSDIEIVRAIMLKVLEQNR